MDVSTKRGTSGVELSTGNGLLDVDLVATEDVSAVAPLPFELHPLSIVPAARPIDSAITRQRMRPSPSVRVCGARRLTADRAISTSK
jgi:hypothetical protein